MQFKGKVRWSAQEERELYQEAASALLGRYEHYSREVRRLRRSWMTLDQLVASAYERSGLTQPPDSEPFFGRIDISFDGGATVESRYIGYMGIDVADTRILDWRAPLAGVYYSARSIGSTQYRVDRKLREVPLTLRRRFEKESIIHTEYLPLPFYGDTPLSAERSYQEYLDELLSRFTDGSMRDIVRTIDSEQNEAIRDTALTVQIIGGPGTGKTSVALHRIAYLNYKTIQESRGRVRANRFAYISPTQLLYAYTSGVFRNIPDTFPEYWSLDMILDELIKAYRKPFETAPRLHIENRLAFEERSPHIDRAVATGMQRVHNAEELEAILYILNRFAADEVRAAIASQDRAILKAALETLIQAIVRLDALQKKLSLREGESGVKSCVNAVKRCLNQLSAMRELLQSVMAILEGLRSAPIPLQGISPLCQLLQGKPFKDLRNSLALLRKRYPYWDALREPVPDESEFKRFSPSLQTLLQLIEPVSLFRRVYGGRQAQEMFCELAGEESLPYIREIGGRPADMVYYDEKPLLILFMQRLFTDTPTPLSGYRVIAIDETQNIPHTTLYCLYGLAPRGCNFILMADPNQQTALLGCAHTQTHATFNARTYQLTNIYRSNPYIIWAASALLGIEVEPSQLQRQEGHIPEARRMEPQSLAEYAHDLLNLHGFPSLAIITKTLREAEQLGSLFGLPVINSDAVRILQGVFVIPLSLCAGLEFDAVIVYNASDKQYAPNRVEDKRRLYVASTRAMHRLIYHLPPKGACTLIDSLVSGRLVQRV